MVDVATEPRSLPGQRTRCEGCQREIVFAVTVAGENGRGGKYMPLDPHEDPAGNTAVRPGHAGVLLARVLKKDETHDRRTEYLAMPHFATCTRRPETPQLPPAVIDRPIRSRRRRR